MVIRVRKAVKNDMSAVLSMMQELAEFTKVPTKPKITVDDLHRDGGFNDNDDILKPSPLFHCFIAEDTEHESTPKMVGYALGSYLFKHSGRCFYMEDIYVAKSHRQMGVGKQIFNNLVRFVKETNCDRLEFHMVEWNPARHFYEKMKATNVTATVGYQYYRLFKDAIEEIADKNHD